MGTMVPLRAEQSDSVPYDRLRSGGCAPLFKTAFSEAGPESFLIPGTVARPFGPRLVRFKEWRCSSPCLWLTRNEILYSLNKPEDFILAIVEFTNDDTHRVYYLRQPFEREPDFGVTSVNYDFAELLARSSEPW
jgi:hypothetical protein